MATCPHCWEPKLFFAPRCPHCNTNTSIGAHIQYLILYSITQVLIWGTVILSVLWLFSS